MPRFRSKELMTRGTGGVIAATTAPSPAHVGQRWFNTATAVTYQYTRDAAGTKFWLDISSGGIGTSASRGVDLVGDTDPHPRSNISGAAVGMVYYNRETDGYFICRDVTTNVNVWESTEFSAKTDGADWITSYIISNVTYRVHVFLTSGTFYLDHTASLDILIVGGGAGGGGEFGGGGGGGGVLYTTSGAKSITAGTYPVVVGEGGREGYHSTSPYTWPGSGVGPGPAQPGGLSSVFGATAYGGGPGQSRSKNSWSEYITANMANGGGGNESTAGQTGTAPSATGFTGYGGNNGGDGGGAGPNYPAGGGAGSGASQHGEDPSSSSADAGDGGNGIQIGTIYDNATNYYWGAGGGGGQHAVSVQAGSGGSGGGGGGTGHSGGSVGPGGTGGLRAGEAGYAIGNGTHAGNGGAHTGSGGGGSTHQYGIGGRGGSGIVLIRYALV